MSAVAAAADDAWLSAAAAAADDRLSKAPRVFAFSSAAMARSEAQSWSARMQSISTERISRSIEAAWRRENDGCQVSAYFGVLHKALSTSQGQQV